MRDINVTANDQATSNITVNEGIPIREVEEALPKTVYDQLSETLGGAPIMTINLENGELSKKDLKLLTKLKDKGYTCDVVAFMNTSTAFLVGKGVP